jgi:signal transduction histidine kinase
MQLNDTPQLDARAPLEGVLRFGVWSILFQAEMLAIHVLAQLPQNIRYYYVSLAIATVFVGLIRFAGPSRLVADIQELCVWDVVIQLIGIALFDARNPQTPTIFGSLANALLLAKSIRLLWPVSCLPMQGVAAWPVFGLIGLVRGTFGPTFAAPRWHQRRGVIYACLLATIPIGYGLDVLFVAEKLTPISYVWFLISLFGLQPLMRKLQHLEAERSAAIAQNHAQAIALAVETDRATHFQRLSEELAASNAERTALLTAARLSNERILHANHDIMQPVFWLTSALQKATQLPTTPAQRELMDKTLSAAHEISDMLSDVFHQVTHETNAQTPAQQVLNVGEIGQYFWDRFFDLADTHNVRLSMGNETFCILANEPRLRRVIANLLNNAILYSGPGASVSLRFARRAGMCHIFVRNSGQGIPDANRPDRIANTTALLERITHAHYPHTERHAQTALIGHGIGLPSTARICAEIGSPLRLRARLGYGSVFHLQMPLAPEKR